MTLICTRRFTKFYYYLCKKTFYLQCIFPWIMYIQENMATGRSIHFRFRMPYLSSICLVIHMLPYYDGTGRWLPSQPYRRRYPQAVASSRLWGTENKLLQSGGINPQRGVWKIRPVMSSWNSTQIWGFHQLCPRLCYMPDNYFWIFAVGNLDKCIAWIWGFLNTV